MLRPNIMTTPAVAAIIDATGIIVSGPKYAKSIEESSNRIAMTTGTHIDPCEDVSTHIFTASQD
jgi:hypothetical protein